MPAKASRRRCQVYSSISGSTRVSLVTVMKLVSPEPARQHVHVQMPRHPGARRRAHVQSHVEAVAASRHVAVPVCCAATTPSSPAPSPPPTRPMIPHARRARSSRGRRSTGTHSGRRSRSSRAAQYSPRDRPHRRPYRARWRSPPRRSGCKRRNDGRPATPQAEPAPRRAPPACQDSDPWAG